MNKPTPTKAEEKKYTNWYYDYKKYKSNIPLDIIMEELRKMPPTWSVVSWSITPEGTFVLINKGNPDNPDIVNFHARYKNL